MSAKILKETNANPLESRDKSTSNQKTDTIGSNVQVEPYKTSELSSKTKDSIYTKMSANLFKYELIPFLTHPRELLVLGCVNRHHAEVMGKRASGLQDHFEEELKS